GGASGSGGAGKEAQNAALLADARSVKADALAESALVDQQTREAQEKSLKEEQEREQRNAAESEKLDTRTRFHGLAAALPSEPEAGTADRLPVMFRVSEGKSVKTTLCSTRGVEEATR
ncbi:unnamed protein product, partial [Amoebophrya sp. A25]